MTSFYRQGAEKALEIAKKNRCHRAILKEKSPSCGKGKIHNGNFDGGLIDGNGLTVELLEKNGIQVFGESELNKL